jgi:hypothetical protein
MLASQSNTESLLQPEVPQEPLLLQPFGSPPPLEQLLHAMVVILRFWGLAPGYSSLKGNQFAGAN